MVDSDRLLLRAPLQELGGHRADLWEAGADERERLADERESLADEREALADERERLAGRHDGLLDHREADRQTQDSRTDQAGEADEATELAAAQSVLRRAEAGVLRADAEVLRARQATARVAGRAARRESGTERAHAAQRAQALSNADEAAWASDRRDFVAADRESLAAERGQVADERDETADLRERRADTREREALAREQALDRQPWNGRGTNQERLASGQEMAFAAEQRDAHRQRRARAAASRHLAAQDHADAAARWGPQPYGPSLLASFADLAQQLFGSDQVTDVLHQLLKFTVDGVAGCDWASITLRPDSGVLDTLASHPVAAELDALQFRTGIGPGPEALESGRPINVPLVPDSYQWPLLAATAAQVGVASCLSHGLFVHQTAQWQTLGAFTMYSADPAAFSEEDQDFGSILAAYAAVAVSMANRRDEVDRREAALHRSLSTRDVIGQAKGILMERQHLTAGDAFDLLRRASQRLNRKLSDVAQHLTDTGELP